MKVTKLFLCVCVSLLFLPRNLVSYHLPALNIGLTGILSGGYLIPTEGWYWLPYLIDYHSTKLLDESGQLLGGVPSPRFNACVIINQFIYQSELEIAHGGRLGFNVTLPVVIASHLEKNNLGLTSSGAGLGDFSAGPYVQWREKYIKGETRFITKLALDGGFPTGKNKQPRYTTNPGDNVYFIRPFWAGTLFFNNKVAASWTWYYLWSSQNKKTHIQPGSATYINYDLEYQIWPKLWIAFTGYFLQQIRDSKLCGQQIPCSRERILGSGCGFLYTTCREWNILSYVYFESLVRNHAQGIRFVFRLVKHF
jgi:hypothetical protein